MSAPGLPVTYQVNRGCREYSAVTCNFKPFSEQAEMINVSKYEETHYCDTENCNKEIMLGDGVIVEGCNQDDESDTESTAAITNFSLLFLLAQNYL